MRAKTTSKLVSLAAVAVLSFGALGAGPPDVEDIPGDPVPNGNNNFGLCTAYFSGSDNGQENKRKAPPFQGLENAADDDENSGSVAGWCEQNGRHPGNGDGEAKGNPHR